MKYIYNYLKFIVKLLPILFQIISVLRFFRVLLRVSVFTSGQVLSEYSKEPFN